MTYSLRPVFELAADQHSLVTRADLRRLGTPPRVLQRAVRTGALDVLGRRTFGIGGAAMYPHRQALAACFDSGGTSTRGTGAWLHDIDGFEVGSPPSVIVREATSDYRLDLAEVHACSWLPADDLVVIEGIPCLSVARTLFSLAAAVPEVPLAAVTNAVDVAVRDGKATDAWLWWLLERIRRRGRNGVSVFEGILTVRAGGQITESWLEREFLAILERAGIVPPVCQRRIRRQGAFVARVDFLYEELHLVIEVSGHTHHSSRLQLSADARRRNRLQLAGYRVIEFTYDDLVGSPAYVIEEVLAARVMAARLGWAA